MPSERRWWSMLFSRQLEEHNSHTLHNFKPCCLRTHTGLQLPAGGSSNTGKRVQT
jgi:hypothetical protein